MAAKPNKTQITAVPVEDFLAGVTPDVRRTDAQTLCKLMQRLSGEAPRMWGPSIVGFGVRHYRYDSGREGEILKIGFSPRKPALVLYGMDVANNEARLAELGKTTTGKGCLYIKTLADIDLSRLEALIVERLTQGA